MKRPTVLHVEDEDRLEALRARMGAATTLEVVREALSRLERELGQSESAEVVGTSSEEVLFDLHRNAGDKAAEPYIDL